MIKKLFLIIFGLFIAVNCYATDGSQSFGKTSNGTSTTAASADYKYASSATPDYSGTVVNGHARVWVDSTSTVAKFFIYDGVASTSNLLAVSDEVTISNTTEADITFPFSGANLINITGGTAYGIGVHFQDPGATNYNISRANTSGLIKRATDTYSDGTAATYGTTTNVNGAFDAYVTYNTPLISTLTDNFNDNSIDTTKWDTYTDTGLTALEVNQEVEITTALIGGYAEFGTEYASGTNFYSLIGSQASIKVISAGNQSLASLYIDLLTMITPGASAALYWSVYGGNIVAGYWNPDSTDLYTASFVLGTYTYLRIRESGGTTYWDYSSDGINWTNATSIANPFTLTALAARFALYSDVELSITTMKVDDFNILPSAGAFGQVIIMRD